MKKIVLENGLTLIYKHIESNLTSLSIALEAGANVEIGEKLGIAHMVEHMVYKGTESKSEDEINNLCDEIFGFNNAMTNYPYVVYYGTSLSEDLEKALELYSDFLLKPSFTEKGFKEEVNVILEELDEWKEDPYQHCEDELLKHAFNSRRIKELIIGNRDSIKSITLEDLKNFHKKYYNPENAVISVVTSLDFEHVLILIKKYFISWKNGENIEESNLYMLNQEDKIYENNNSGIFKDTTSNLKGCKIQYAFPIYELTQEEIKILRIFNVIFGEGTSSILYDEIRTKNGLAYDIGSTIKNEKGIKLFKIYLGTSKEKSEMAIDLINSKIEELKNENIRFSEERVNKLIKSFKLKRSLNLEKSINQSVHIADYEIMYGNRENAGFTDFKYISPLMEEVQDLNDITEEKIYAVIEKVFKNPTIEILSGN